MTIKRALISCTDKTGIVEFAKFLNARGVHLLSTGGTSKLLRDSQIPVTEVADFTGSPEILDGRVKTLHPKIHGGILNIRANADHQKQIAQNNIESIDMVIVNLYEFEKTVADPKCTLEHAIENIDIGGPSMLRSAAKNHRDVVVIVDPKDYICLREEIEKTGDVSQATRFQLAVKVFQKTAQYDSAISEYLNTHNAQRTTHDENQFSQKLILPLTKIQDLRYGENPHQAAAFYRDDRAGAFGIAQAEQLQGKELSFNNILDLDAAYRCSQEFSLPACVIVKHTNPCGVAVADILTDAFVKARSADPVSSFGGIIAMNRTIDEQTALIIAETFFEAVIAPDYSEQAKAIFKNKKNLRVMKLGNLNTQNQKQWDLRRVSGGILLQDTDTTLIDVSKGEVVTKRKPTAQEIHDLTFAWAVVKHVKSNAIVFARNGQNLGVGAGQMSRVDSVKIAVMKAEEIFQRKNILQGSVLASDAFFPFRDGLDFAAKQGITAVVQPGGSVRDEEVIAAANENDIAMVFTKERHFKH